MNADLISDVKQRPVDVSVVIVSWNVASLLADCIRSIVANAEGLAVEIVVVDNASTDHTVPMLASEFPRVQVIASTKNEGFARANNLAFRRVAGRFVLILNPDTVLGDGSMSRMVDFLKSHSEFGMVGPRLSYPDGSVQETCARLLPTLASSLFCHALRLTKVPVIGEGLTKRFVSPYDYNVSQEVNAISGAAMLVRREVLQEAQGFRESFTHCGEDVELCFRVRTTGWGIYYLADAHVVHFTGQSAKQAPVRIAVNTALSIQEYFNRCFGKRHGTRYRFIVQAIQVPIMLLTGLAKMVLRVESGHEFKQRMKMAKAIWLWRAVD